MPTCLLSLFLHRRLPFSRSGRNENGIARSHILVALAVELAVELEVVLAGGEHAPKDKDGLFTRSATTGAGTLMVSENVALTLLQHGNLVRFEAQSPRTAVPLLALTTAFAWA
jgi:hypothetical protein